MIFNGMSTHLMLVPPSDVYEHLRSRALLS